MSRENTRDYLSLFLSDTPLLDVRSPVEFDKGAFANTQNIPLMNDQQRHLVGICYKQQGQEAAIALGRELVTPSLQAERTEQWLTFVKNHPQGYLYCFRGGLRSRITQNWIAEGGIDYPYIEGGYKAMRRFLIDRFEQDVGSTDLILISGRTGTGKTRLLNAIKRSVDIEGLARHRGSSFGLGADAQPSSINFENDLAVALLKLTHNDSRSPVFVEGEGRLVGQRTIPEVLWNKMCTSPIVVLEAPIEFRVQVGLEDYVVDLLQSFKQTNPGIKRDIVFDMYADRHRQSLSRIQKRFGPERYATASALLEQALEKHRIDDDIESYRPFIVMLLEQYYDPMYDYQLERRDTEVLFRGDAVVIADWIESTGGGELVHLDSTGSLAA